MTNTNKTKMVKPGIIKLGIIGCGKHVLQAHAIPCKNLDGFNLISLYDISEEQMVDFEQEYGKNLNKFKNKKEFFESIDAVIISTPDKYHYGDLVAAIEAGKHVFVEKPLITVTEDLETFSKTLEIAQNKNLVLSTCHPRRYDAQFIWLKENLGELEETLGEIISMEFDFSYHKPTKDWKEHRGLLLDHMNHEIDLMHYLIGYCEFTARKIIDSFDYYHAIGKRTDGITFDFKGTRRLESRTYLETLKLRFDCGEITARNGVITINEHDLDDIRTITLPTNYALRGRKTIENFIQSIQCKEECYINNIDLYVNNAIPVMLTENVVVSDALKGMKLPGVYANSELSENYY